jgi:hypothetical protein
MKKISYLISLSILLSIMLSCNNGKDEWLKAKSENTVDALENFVEAFPKSVYTEIANKSIDSIYYSMDLFPVVINNKHGFIDNKGQLKIKNQFNSAFDFIGMFALVKDSLHWGIINKKGEYIIKPEYDEMSEFSDGLAAVKKDSLWGFIDTTGNLTIPYAFSDAWSFSDKLALVEKDNKWGFINTAGSFVIPAKYQRAYIHDNGTMMYTVDSVGTLMITLTCKNGKKIIKKDFEFFEQKPNYFGGNYWGYTDKKGNNQLTADSSDCIDEFENGMARIIVNQKWGYINAEDKLIINPEYDYCSFFENNIALIKKNDLFGYIDSTGKILITPKYITASIFFGDYAIVQMENSDRITFIDKMGKPMTNLKIISATSFINGIAGVMINEKWGFIDKNFKFVIQPQFDEIESLHNNFVLVKNKDKWGLINRKGDIVVDCKYDRIEFKGELAYVTLDSIEAYIDTTGKYIWKSEPIKQ